MVDLDGFWDDRPTPVTFKAADPDAPPNTRCYYCRYAAKKIRNGVPTCPEHLSSSRSS